MDSQFIKKVIFIAFPERCITKVTPASMPFAKVHLWNKPSKRPYRCSRAKSCMPFILAASLPHPSIVAATMVTVFLLRFMPVNVASLGVAYTDQQLLRPQSQSCCLLAQLAYKTLLNNANWTPSGLNYNTLKHERHSKGLKKGTFTDLQICTQEGHCKRELAFDHSPPVFHCLVVQVCCTLTRLASHLCLDAMCNVILMCNAGQCLEMTPHGL